MQHTKKLFFLLVITVIYASTLWGVTLEKITERNSNIDLSEFHMDEESKKNGSSYNQKTHVLVSKGGAGIGRFRGELIDASDYNSLKIKYKVKEGNDFGCIFTISYFDIQKEEEKSIGYYLPVYLTEFEIPLQEDYKKTIRGLFTYTWGRPIMDTEIEFESISFEKKIIKDPTNPNYSDLPPVIDNGPQVQFDNTISAMNFIKKLGAGVNLHDYLMVNNFDQDFGLDSWTCWGQPEKITKEHIIDLIKD